MALTDVLMQLAGGAELDSLAVAAATGLAEPTVREQLAHAARAGGFASRRRGVNGRFFYRITERGRDYLGTPATQPSQPSPPAGQQYHPPVQAHYPPPARTQVTFARTPTPVAFTPPRYGLRDLIRAPADRLEVFRVEGSSVTAKLPKEWTADHFGAAGGDVFSFILRHVVPDHGGGVYLVRGTDVATGQVLLEERVKVAGNPRFTQAPPSTSETAAVPSSGNPLLDALRAARAWISALPSPEQRALARVAVLSKAARQQDEMQRLLTGEGQAQRSQDGDLDARLDRLNAVLDQTIAARRTPG